MLYPSANQQNMRNPLLLNPAGINTYDSSVNEIEPSAYKPDVQKMLSEKMNNSIENPANNDINFSSIMGKWAGTYKMPTRSKNDLQKTALTTPSSYKTLNPDMKNLGSVTTEWGDSTRYEKFHPAIDIANNIGTPIPAFASGTVTAVESGHKQGDKGYGNYVIITDANGDKHRYSHLNNSFVKIGQKINKGQQLGSMGNTGSTYSPSGKGTGSHLDYRIVDAYNKAVNPHAYLKNIT